MSLPVIAIVGRPNVGKSTFLNACAKRLVSVVDPTEGVTRDRVSHPMVLKRKAFELMDTGGIGIVDAQELDTDVERQIELALSEASVIVFLVDSREGILPLDRRVAKRLHELGKPVIFAANKTESRNLAASLHEFRQLGFGEPLALSAQNHEGVQAVLEAAVAELPKNGPAKVPASDLRVAIVGRRNAGKSTLLNALCGQERVIVSEKPGTTRDAVDIAIERDDGQRWLLIDTAGLTTHAHDGRDPIQWYSEHRSLLAVRRSDVTILLVDATLKVGGLEKRLAKEVADNGKPCILAVNKWDLVPDTPTSEFETYYRGVLPGLDRAPIAFISAKTRLNVQRMLDVCADLARQGRQKITTGALNRFVQVAIDQRSPRVKSSQRAKIYYATQVGVSPPRFAIFVNDPNLFDPEFHRYLENRFRDTFPFPEVPVLLHFRSRDRKPLDSLKSGR
ncbi:MAG: ribosome biogenesis GTPase Der [Planctomycetes bacterium]|nr:ribosome biogenesis GTPase Der [Planctomycetota bacterium]